VFGPPADYSVSGNIRNPGVPRTSPDEEAAESSGEDDESDIPTTATASGAGNGATATQPQRSRLGQEATAAATQQVRLCSTTLCVMSVPRAPECSTTLCEPGLFQTPDRNCRLRSCPAHR